MKYLVHVLSLLATSSLVSADAPKNARPNFLIIVADDLCWRDLGYQGHPDVRSPNIDRLAKEGMRLEGMFDPAATCSPTRHALYTGLYPIRSGAYPNHTRAYDGTKSIFSYLKDLNYRTALQRKEHVGPKPSFPYEHIAEADDLSQTKAFIQRNANQPWMLSFCSNDPHSVWNRGPGDYDPAKIAVPPYMHDNKTTRANLADYFSEITQLDTQVGNFLELLDETGQSKNTLVLFVSEQGCSLPYGGKWTLYDTGVRVSAIARWPEMIEPGSQSNALMQYVDVVPTLIELAGADPTKLDTGCPDANGVRTMDGKSFVSIILGKSGVAGKSDHFRELVYAQHTTVGVSGYKEPYPSRMVRDSRYKLIRNLAPENIFSIGGIHQGPVIESWQADAKKDPVLAKRVEWLFKRPGEELYDLDSDPFEMTNLASDPKMVDVMTRLQKELDRWMQQQGDKGLETEMLAPTRQGAGRDTDRSEGKAARPKRVKPNK